MNLWHPRAGNEGVAFLTTYNMEWQSTDLYVANRSGSSISVGQPVVFKEQDPSERMGEPTLRFYDRQGPHQLQHLFNSLWEAGLRPPKDQSVDIEPVIQAKDQHLNDLRTCLFSQMGIKK